MVAEEQIEILSSVISGRPRLSERAASGPSLHRLFAEHRVSGRALDYIERHRPAWSDEALAEQLRAQQQANAGAIAQHAAAMRMLRDEWLSRDEPIVIIKGLALYAHTRRPQTIRPTLDADILVTEPQRLVSRMKAANLQEYRKVSPHELINVTLAGVPIDLHAHYPAWSIDRHLGRPLLSSRGGLQIHEHVSRLIVTQIPVEALLDNALPAAVFGVPGVYYPSASMSALITCVHCFRDYLSRSSVTARSKPPLKFAEIAEFADYLTLPEFDIGRFCEATNRYHAQDAVEWLVEKVEAHHRVPEVVKVTHRIRAGIQRPMGTYVMPAQAVWTGFWASLKRDAADMLLQHAHTAEVVARLGPISIPLENGQAKVAVRSGGDIAGAGPTGTVHVRAQGCLPMQVTACCDGASLALEIEVERPSAERQIRLHLDLEGQALEIQWRAQQEFWKKSNDFPNPVVVSTADGCVVRIHVRVPVTWDRSVGRTPQLPLVLAVGDFAEGFDIGKGTLLPLVLSFNPQ